MRYTVIATTIRRMGRLKLLRCFCCIIIPLQLLSISCICLPFGFVESFSWQQQSSRTIRNNDVCRWRRRDSEFYPSANPQRFLTRSDMQQSKQDHQQQQEDGKGGQEEDVITHHKSSISSSLQDPKRRKILRTMTGIFGSAGFLASSPSIGSAAMDILGSSGGGSSSSNNSNSNGSVNSQRVGGLANKIRGILKNMDELQRDLMQERWDLVMTYPGQLRSYVPVFTTYTDAAFPSDAPTDYGLRVALRYEVGRYFGSLERLKRATGRQDLEEAYIAYAEMSLHLDRYLRVGGLYTYYDSTIDNEQLFQEYKDALVASDPIKDPAEVRDLIVLVKGPDTGKTGILIGVYKDGSNNCVVKLDKSRGMREVRVVPRTWAAKRLGEQDPDEVFLIPRKGAKS